MDRDVKAEAPTLHPPGKKAEESPWTIKVLKMGREKEREGEGER